MLLLGYLFFTLIGVSLQSLPEDLNQELSSSTFSLTVSQAGLEGRTVSGVVNCPINFTLTLNDWHGDQLQLGWTSNGVYVIPKDEIGHKIVFWRGQTNQTIHLEANLIGVYSIRFFKEEEEKGERVWISEEAEVELVVRRENMEGNQIITLVIFVLLGVGLFFMGMELDIAVVISSMKVIKHCQIDSCKLTFEFP